MTEPSAGADRITRSDDGRLLLHAHAKLNLGLRIFPARPDGFHTLESWFVPISWHDSLAISPSDQPLSLTITGRSEGVPTDLAKNLVGRAALALAQHAGIPPTGHIALHKALPPGGGLGGGSSDAANALLALNIAWNLHLDESQLLALAARLGSDVPFFIRSQSCLCTGLGEVMTPLHYPRPLFAVLLIPPEGCPTRDVYAAFDAGHQHPTRPEPSPAFTWPQFAEKTADELNALLVNDLEPAAFHVAPGLRTLRDRAANALRRPVHVTGSGSTLFTLCSSAASADETQATLAAALGPDAFSLPVRILANV